MKNIVKFCFLLFSSIAVGVALGLIILMAFIVGTPFIKIIWITILVILTTLLSIQAIFTLFLMLYAWENPKEAESHKSPSEFLPPKHTFTALIPARHEEKVIEDTIRAVNAISYPNHLKEIIILCRSDDVHTISVAQQVINLLQNLRVKLVLFDGYPINKPRALNFGLAAAKNSVITIFDAEDSPHPDIYNVVNTTMIESGADVVQSGVQLMNYRSHWFSALNCMEYFFWFKSSLHFFSKVAKVTPLGGNTVFFKKSKLQEIGGWDEKCLTEDADVGFRLARAGATVKVVYDEKHTTAEETPHNTVSFIKQRTRWNQGFLQIAAKNDWSNLPTWSQRLLALYILLSPETQAVLLIYTPLALWFSFVVKLPIIISLFSFVPLLLFVLQLVVLIIGLYEFTRAYKLPFPIWMPLKIVITFFPYQCLLAFSSLRATWRFILRSNAWEKTMHTNIHRSQLDSFYAK